jgi:hypothetical protein
MKDARKDLGYPSMYYFSMISPLHRAQNPGITDMVSRMDFSYWDNSTRINIA